MNFFVTVLVFAFAFSVHASEPLPQHSEGPIFTNKSCVITESVVGQGTVSEAYHFIERSGFCSYTNKKVSRFDYDVRLNKMTGLTWQQCYQQFRDKLTQSYSKISGDDAFEGKNEKNFVMRAHWDASDKDEGVYTVECIQH